MKLDSYYYIELGNKFQIKLITQSRFCIRYLNIVDVIRYIFLQHIRHAQKISGIKTIIKSHGIAKHFV